MGRVVESAMRVGERVPMGFGFLLGPRPDPSSLRYSELDCSYRSEFRSSLGLGSSAFLGESKKDLTFKGLSRLSCLPLVGKGQPAGGWLTTFRSSYEGAVPPLLTKP